MRYRKPFGVEVKTVRGRSVISTPQGGRIAVDSRLVKLWEQPEALSVSGSKSQSEKSEKPSPDDLAAFACLAEAGLLVREGWSPDQVRPVPASDTPAPISVVIVNFNSQDWLAECLPSVFSQTIKPAEVIVVDNASLQDPTTWLRSQFPEVRVIRLVQMQGLASAINRGLGQTWGEFILILNPDVRLEPDAVARMLEVARTDPQCAAVAPKLRFWWAPAFLNGIGNQAGYFRWGSDNGLGWLDLGQFDQWEEVPSACFAATLVRRSAWEAVGPCDEGFRFYYEDTDWSYRARLYGYKVLAVPKAVVYHAFGRRVHTGEEKDLTPAKLRNVVYGRLRFLGKIATGQTLLRFFLAALIHDATRAVLLLLTGDWRGTGALLGGWVDFIASVPDLRPARKTVQSRRVRTDAEIFSLQSEMPSPLIWRGLPLLTWDIAGRHYLPAILSGKTRALPEFESWSDAGR